MNSRRFIPLLLLILPVSGCIPENDALSVILPATNQIIIPEYKIPGDTLRVHFYAPGSWTATFSAGNTWVDVSPSTGTSGNKTTYIYLRGLNTTGTPRIDSLRIYSNEQTVSVPVYQAVTSLALYPGNVVLQNTAQYEQSFHIASATDWTIAFNPEQVPWLSVQPLSGGPGTHQVVIKTLEANNTYDDRNTVLRTTAGEFSQNITVTQKQKDALLLSSDVQNIPSEGGDFSVEIQHNTDYTVAVPAAYPWIVYNTPNPVATKGLISSMEYFTVREGTEDGARHGTVIFSNGTLSDTLHVYQAQIDRLILSNEFMNIPAAGGEYPVQLRTNIQYDIIIPGSPDWLEMITTKAIRTDVLNLLIHPLTGDESRTAQVIVRDQQSTLSDTLTVYQSPREELSVEPSTVYLEEEAVFAVNLSTNVPYVVIIPEDAGWITLNQTDPVSLTELAFSAAPNPLLTQRQTAIIISSESEQVKDTLTVTQAPYAQQPLFQSSLPGVYSPDNLPLAIYTPFVNQCVVFNAEDGLYFRIQHLGQCKVFSFGPVPEEAVPGDHLHVEIIAEGFAGLSSGTRSVVLLRSRENKLWLVDTNDFTGYVIQNELP
ncbi:MAG TPA: BACON domain-containing carbohydrate-binding protein [Bacteroidales bacterium]|nr:BACON domain-containing carbohydrate-binding protein [Bacteroidales bacterium]